MELGVSPVPFVQLFEMFMYLPPWWVFESTLHQGTNISHLGKWKIIFKSALVRDMNILVSRRVLLF